MTYFSQTESELRICLGTPGEGVGFMGIAKVIQAGYGPEIYLDSDDFAKRQRFLDQRQHPYITEGPKTWFRIWRDHHLFRKPTPDDEGLTKFAKPPEVLEHRELLARLIAVGALPFDYSVRILAD